MSSVEYHILSLYIALRFHYFLLMRCALFVVRRVWIIFGEYAVHCKELPDFKYRHDFVRDVLFDIFRRA